MSFYRNLSTHIINACRENGLKQSVVLSAITKFYGFRSIQAAESAASNNTPKSTLALTVTIRTDLYRSFPNAEFTAINPVNDLLAESVVSGDSILDTLWNLAYTDPHQVYPTLQSMLHTAEQLLEYIHALGAEQSVDLDTADKLDCLQGKHPSIVSLLLSELKVASDPLQSAPGYSIIDTQIDMVSKINNDLIFTLEAFTAEHYNYFDVEWF